MPLFRKIDEFRFELPRQGGMRVPGLVYASEAMLPKIERERVAEQVANVAHLPGIVGHSLAMPDCHWGYGAPVGGAAAVDAAEGVISPGLVGYDISCGIRLLRSDLYAAELKARIPELMDGLHARVASGVGKGGSIRLDERGVREVLRKGALWAVERGLGERADLETCEDGGFLRDAAPEAASERAAERGRGQMGTLGSGNHFLELQAVDEIYDEGAAAVFGLFKGQLTVLVHTGSRGLGYQICEDALRVMQRAAGKYHIALPDRQLACAPLSSSEGQEYYAAMCAAANYARANRQAITHAIREAFSRVLGTGPHHLGLRVVYDVCHNIAKYELHEVDGKPRRLLVHRKGATRAFPAGHPDVPALYRKVGQPVLVPGSMGTASYVLAGCEKAMKESFGTACHGAGRLMSRTQALKLMPGHQLAAELGRAGVCVRTDSYKGLAEEAPAAYKDVDEVVEVCHRAGLARKVARMRPVGVLKG
ncbi:MAG TPA: RNA-splicing ligase RtcB [Elusimicrobia bacterium]|nr:RNA-splicing ligase RtcB [Elusimicrobiota bacterium]